MYSVLSRRWHNPQFRSLAINSSYCQWLWYTLMGSPVDIWLWLVFTHSAFRTHSDYHLLYIHPCCWCRCFCCPYQEYSRWQKLTLSSIDGSANSLDLFTTFLSSSFAIILSQQAFCVFQAFIISYFHRWQISYSQEVEYHWDYHILV